MDQSTIDQLSRRIDAAYNAEIALLIDTDLFMLRHDYFGKELCQSLGIVYRNDIPGDEIINDAIPETIGKNINIKCTPDNYTIKDGVTFIIDYKVVVNDETIQSTYNKYYNIFKPYFEEYNRQFEIVIISCNPYNCMIKHTGVLFENFFNINGLELDFGWFFSLKDALYDKFRDDELFMSQAGPGEFSMTAPWCENNAALEDDPEFRKFINTLEPKEQSLFLRAIHYDPFKADKWSDFLLQTKESYKNDYTDYINDAARDIFSLKKTLEKPSHDEIAKGWEQMYERMKLDRNLTKDPTKQKPSLHFIWAKPDFKRENNQISKLIFFSKRLQSLKGTDLFIEVFRKIGENFDISCAPDEYQNFCSRIKSESRLQEKERKSKKLDSIHIGTSKVLWEQQFKMDLNPISQDIQSRFKTKFLGIGKGKRFALRTEQDVSTDKPKMLDFEDKVIIDAANEMMHSVKGVLSKRSELIKIGCFLDEYKHNIYESSKETWNTIEGITSTQYWSAINDFSVLMKGILGASQYNKHNTFRLCFCANNSIMAVVYPSSDIKTKQATTCYSIIAFHKDKDELMDPGCNYKTFETISGFLSISKPIRLDKERCQRIVTSPGLFLQSCLLMYNNNPTIKLQDVMNFCLFTSLSITKPLLTLTEPSRYMIMNSLAITSSVKGYIGEKFNPMTKTLFSVYMSRLIRDACSEAFNQKHLIQPRRIALDDYDITQKGVEESRLLKSIWFSGSVSLKEYINQIYLPFYFNSKGLHEKHHVMIDLAKTILEIESEQRRENFFPWSTTPKPQSVNLKVLIYGIARQLHLDTQRKSYLRMKIENRNNFKRKIYTISTLTSSKSCIEQGDFTKEKGGNLRQAKNIANPAFVEEFELNQKVEKSTYLDLKAKIPDYIDIRSTKVFDILYQKSKQGEIQDEDAIKYMLSVMQDKEEYVFSFFNKGQKTAKDREIFVGEYETKMALYVIERIMKELCKSNPEEMISEPGDSKLKVLENIANQEIREIISVCKKNRTENDTGLKTNKKPIKIDINADMSKWSAQDVTYKYFWLIALNPILYPEEKTSILKFFCRYMNKKLILPDALLNSIFDQFKEYENDIIKDMTMDFKRNWVQIRNNWFQGNLNYTSSYIHTVSMGTYKDIIKKGLALLDGEAFISSLVHSDDNHTSIIANQGKLDDDDIIRFCYDSFIMVCLSHGNQVNKKKTYVTNGLKEFVSLFNIFGEPFSIYGRFLLTSVGDCAYLGPYEDLSSRITSVQTAIKHGCPPSYAWVAIAMSQWLSYSTYNMMPGQYNDPCEALMIQDRFLIPIELGGLLNCPLHMLVLLGLDSINVYNLYMMVSKLSSTNMRGQRIEDILQDINNWSIAKLSDEQIFQLKVLRYITLGVEIDSASKMGETSDMRNRSVLTPRKFTTQKALIKLDSYKDYKNLIIDEPKYKANLEYMINHPELLVTKGENNEDYKNTILFRYNSKRFKESLSIQNPAQLFIEQVLFSKKPTIDYTRISDKFTMILEQESVSQNIIGKKTIKEALESIRKDLKMYEVSKDDLGIVMNCVVVNDPLAVTTINSEILHVLTEKKQRNGLTCSTMPEFRNIKIINYSPAVVIRAYRNREFCPPNADPQILERDVWFLQEFIRETGIEEKAKDHIRMNEVVKGEKDLIFEIQEWTRFYQSCYSYIKATEHKVKMFIIPNRVSTATQFCQSIIGNLKIDSHYFGCYFQKNAIGYNQKGLVSSSLDMSTLVADECFRLIAHFTDQVVSKQHRNKFVDEIIKNYTFRNYKVSTLLEKLLNSNRRTSFLPILFHLNKIKTDDMERFQNELGQKNVIWNNWQSNRSLNTGPIDLKLVTHSATMHIIGMDKKLNGAIMSVRQTKHSNIKQAGRNLLSARHNLSFEMFEKCEIQPKNWYICSQRRNAKRVFYDVKTGADIQNENNVIEFEGRKSYVVIPHCEVTVHQKYDDAILDYENIKFLNEEEVYYSKLIISENTYATVRKIDLSKMQDFDGPPILSSKLNITQLMKSRTLLSCNYDRVIGTSLLELSNVIECKGTDAEMNFDFLNDDIMDADEFEVIEATPNLKIQYGKRGQSYMTLQNAFVNIMKEKSLLFKSTMTFTGDGFTNGENMAYLINYISLLNHLNLDGEAKELYNVLHLIFIDMDMDATFHLADFSKEFLIDGRPNYRLLGLMVDSMKCKHNNIWSYLFNKAAIQISHALKAKDAENSPSISQILKSISKKFANIYRIQLQRLRFMDIFLDVIQIVFGFKISTKRL
ncbi:RNA-dependent RNA polymerase [Rio Preto da Eva virus]|uniref:RNA-directed RNA polymerase L n=1 Tax=Rio Preto da Eva virus TaxID=1538455 RepID=A0A088NRE9_9VIRU|nr:RNA-dependent RNA polymerase [Rio Preto da Eva virus]AIN55744.1 RNA-dependent RNA polymerase [Rio Preto da Eva virus]